MKSKIVLFTFLITSCLLSPYSQWIQTSGPAGTDIYSMFIDGTDMYAGTGKCVYYSSDFGTSWVWRSNGINAMPPYPVCFLKNNGVLFTCVSSGGVYITTDKGLTWLQTNNGMPPLAAVYCLTVYNNVILAGSNCGMFLSTDNGSSWFKPTTYPPLVTSFLVSGNNIFAGGVYGVYLSTDNGYNWSHTYTSFYTFRGFASIGTNIFAISQVQLFISTNGGSNWTILTNPAGPDFLNEIFSFNNKLFLCSRDSGLFISSDNGLNWTLAPSSFHSRFPSTIISDGNYLYCGAFHRGGIYKSTNSGASWKPMNGGFANCGINGLAVSGNMLFAATNLEGVHYSNDFGATWVMLAPQLPDGGFSCITAQNNYVLTGNRDSLYLSSDLGANFTPVRGDSVSGTGINGNYMFEGCSNGIVRSTDYGVTWATVNPSCARSFAFSGSTVIAGCKNKVLKSTDYGGTWVQVHSAYYGWVMGIVFMGDFVFAATNGEAVLKSTDMGETWNYCVMGFTSGFMNTITAYNGYLFATSDDVYISADSGNTWMKRGDGITQYGPTQLVVQVPYMFSGTFDLSVWKRTLVDLIAVKKIGEKVPETFYLSQNYPNPFNPETKINLSIPHITQGEPLVKLVIYDVLGRQVETLLNKKMQAGIYDITWNATGYASGVYFYMLIVTKPGNVSAPDYSMTKKMILIK